ncbi:hypothetical protein [Chitinibacter sp. S2-10]|uniref:hypothetical protein n=1 Tax=Chitinibacter sp. S2-10 TaxID=3373597 RepID=UPI0039774AF2
MKRNLHEIAHQPIDETLDQLKALILEPTMVCTILAISPQHLQGKLAWGAHLNVLIVHDQDWHLLRDAPAGILAELLPVIGGIHRIFFVQERIEILKSRTVEQATDYLVGVQPCLLDETTVPQLDAIAEPLHGTAVNLAQAALPKYAS